MQSLQGSVEYLLRLDRLDPTGPIVGAFLDSEFGETETSLAAGEPVFLYTDGLTEAQRGHDMYGEGRLFTLLAKMGHVSTGDMIGRVLGEVMKFAGSDLRDDLAMLVFKWVPDE